MVNTLHDVWQHLQGQLFPLLVEEVGELGEKDRQFIEVMALLPLGALVERFAWQGIGRPPAERTWLLHSFIAKSVYQFATTEAMVEALLARPTLRRLCGWDSVSGVPSLSTFSRAFAEFAQAELPQHLHEALVKRFCGPLLVGHTSHDATAIPVPERPPVPAPPNGPGRRPSRAPWTGPAEKRPGTAAPAADAAAVAAATLPG